MLGNLSSRFLEPTTVASIRALTLLKQSTFAPWIGYLFYLCSERFDKLTFLGGQFLVLILVTLFIPHMFFQMPLGRQCVDHYRMLHRYNVFSHDEMVCNMASKAETLDVVLASAVHKDMVAMIQDEDKQRERVKTMVG